MDITWDNGDRPRTGRADLSYRGRAGCAVCYSRRCWPAEQNPGACKGYDLPFLMHHVTALFDSLFVVWVFFLFKRIQSSIAAASPYVSSCDIPPHGFSFSSGTRPERTAHGGLNSFHLIFFWYGGYCWASVRLTSARPSFLFSPAAAKRNTHTCPNSLQMVLPLIGTLPPPVLYNIGDICRQSQIEFKFPAQQNLTSNLKKKKREKYNDVGNF